MKLRYIVLSSLLVCGAMLSVDMNTSQAAKDNVSSAKPVSTSEYGEVKRSGKLKGEGSTMEYTIYENSEGYKTAVYTAGYVGKAVKDLNSGDPNPYDLPEADHHLFTGEILDESLKKLFYQVQTQKITMNKTPNLKNASDMFGYSSASEIDVSKMTTGKVTNMFGMFRDSQVRKLDVSNWDTSNVTDMKSVFSSSQVQQLDLSNWDTSNVTNMGYMFQNSKVQQLDLSNWDTSNVTHMWSMFKNSQVQQLDLSNWDTSNVTKMKSMFYNSQIKTITYGPKFGPIGGSNKQTLLPTPSTDNGYTGNWTQLNSKGAIGDPLTQDEFLTYIPDSIQTWTWQRTDNDYSHLLPPQPLTSTAKTNGMLTFKQNTEVADPSNPAVLDPTKPNIPIEKPEGGSGGSGFKNFYINYVTDFNFNDIKITGGDMEHFADPIKMGYETFAPFVQVTDNRGIVDGWKLEVVPSTFTNGENELKGAELVITDGVITGNNGQSDEVKPQMGSSLKLSPGSITSVMSAEKDKGYGTWSLNFTDQEDGSFSNTSGIKAVIPVSALPKVGVTYTANFTWTLSATPE